MWGNWKLKNKKTKQPRPTKLMRLSWKTSWDWILFGKFALNWSGCIQPRGMFIRVCLGVRGIYMFMCGPRLVPWNHSRGREGLGSRAHDVISSRMPVLHNRKNCARRTGITNSKQNNNSRMRFAITSAKFLHPCCFLFFFFHTKGNFIIAIAMFLLFSDTYFFLVFCRMVTCLLLGFKL